MSERYEVEVITPEGERRVTLSDLDDAVINFYHTVAMDYREPSTEVALHDLVAGVTLASFVYDPNADVGKVLYDVNK